MPVNKDFYTLAGSSGQSTGYTIDQSIRFARTDNTTGGNCMHRTPSGAGNRKKWTFSLWFKLGAMNNFAQGSGHYYGIFSVDAATNDANRAIWTIAAPSGGADTFRMQFQGHGTIFFLTTREFKDPSAWYHAVLVWDTFDGVAGDRQKLFINGVRETNFQTLNNPTSEQEIGMNLASRTLIGASRNISTSQDIYRWDGYMADIHFLDGYAYGPEYFGEFDSNGIWIPKEYTGSYGSNGYKIDGRDASDLGDDESGNGNDFTTINHDTSDQRTDSPTNNHCTMNPLRPGSVTFTEGNTYATYSASSWTSAMGTIGIPYNSGIYYYEAKVISHAIYLSFGWGDVDMGQNQNNNPATPKFFVYGDYSGKYYSSTDDGAVGDAWDNNDVIGLWYDSGSTSNNLKFYRNGTLQSSGTKSFDFSDVAHVAPLTQFYSGNSVEYRFDSAYWTNAPAGITALNAITTNNVGS